MKTAYIVFILVVFGCAKEQQSDTAHDHNQHQEANEQFTCPMHPDVRQDKPGKCPVCGMDLVKASSASSVDIMFNDTQMRLANITTQKVLSRFSGKPITTNGRLTLDEQKNEVISSRIAGRIEKLHIKEIGRQVRKGQPLYQIASDELYIAQQEFLVASQQAETLGKAEQRYQSYLKAAEKKLLLYGMSAQQLDELKDRKAVHKLTTFFATTSGVVNSVDVAEGQYVAEGASLYKVGNTKSLWLEVELYGNEVDYIKMNDKIGVSINGFESTPFETKISFLSPEYRSNSQITVMRALVDNSSGKFTAGMQAQVTFSITGTEGLTVPVDAVVRTSHGNHVFVQTGKNTFQPRQVTMGVEDRGRVQITEGLMDNEIVAASGAYLIYSELVLKHGESIKL